MKIFWQIRVMRVITFILLNATFCFLAAQTFSPQLLYIDNNEACNIADLDQDGLLDLVAGRNWYAAPDFVPRPLRAIGLHPPDYARNNGEHIWDVNDDSWPDIITTGWGEKRILWYENPGEIGLQKGLPWAVHTLAEVGHGDGEIASFEDLDGDGIPEYIINSYVKSNPFRVFRFEAGASPTLVPATIGSRNSHGVGFGDVNGDGRIDVLFDEGWYEQPATNIWSQTWTWHKDWNRSGGSCPMLVVDLDEDGRNDVIWGRGHDYGLFWYQQLAPSGDTTKWSRHLIDSTWSQAHALKWMDLNGNGKNQLIAGKRIYAHSGKDPGSADTPSIYYYDWDEKKLQFQRTLIAQGDIGTGLFIRAADLNLDGRQDLIMAGKTGTYILWQEP